MRPQDTEKLILAAGIAVLSLSLAVPAFQKLAELHEVRDVASRVADVPRLLMASGRPGKTLSLQVKNLVDGLSLDAAFADARGRDGKPASTPLMSEKKRDPERPAEEADEMRVAISWSGPDDAQPQVRSEKKLVSWTFPAH